MITRNAIYNQNIIDACLWCYGTITKLSGFLSENGLAADDNIQQGDEIIFNDKQGNRQIKTLYKRNNFIPISGETVPFVPVVLGLRVSAPEFDAYAEIKTERNVVYNQNIFDACLWCYGTIKELSRFLTENNFSADETIKQGESIVFDKNVGNEQIKTLYKRNNYIPVSIEIDDKTPFAWLWSDNENNFTLYSPTGVAIYK